MSNNVAPVSTPLSRVMMPNGGWKHITPQIISMILTTAINFFRTDLVFEAKDVSTRFLCGAGTMDPLCTGININIINLIGRCCNNEMLHYLNVQAETIIRSFPSLMLSDGTYSFVPHQEAPSF